MIENDPNVTPKDTCGVTQSLDISHPVVRRTFMESRMGTYSHIHLNIAGEFLEFIHTDAFDDEDQQQFYGKMLIADFYRAIEELRTNKEVIIPVVDGGTFTLRNNGLNNPMSFDLYLPKSPYTSYGSGDKPVNTSGLMTFITFSDLLRESERKLRSTVNP